MRSFAMNASRLICALTLAGAGVAYAEPRPTASAVEGSGAVSFNGQDVAPARNNSFELSLGAGYGQGLGPVGSGVPKLQDFGHAGGTFVVEGGWRFDPRWMVGAYSEYGYFGSGDGVGSNNAKSATAGVQAQFHGMPDRRYDPWVGLGFGWRGYWADGNAGTHNLQGLDLVRARVGLDYRLSQDLAIGPTFGITVTDFISEKQPGTHGYSNVNDRKINTFLFGGFAARFNLL
jgi:hypothetical protein